MKVIQRIPTDQYAYIEVELEYATVEEAYNDHLRLLKFHSDGTGISASEWKKVRENMLITSQCDPNIMERMNKSQRWWVNETKLALRGITKQEEEDNSFVK